MNGKSFASDSQQGGALQSKTTFQSETARSNYSDGKAASLLNCSLARLYQLRSGWLCALISLWREASNRTTALEWQIITITESASIKLFNNNATIRWVSLEQINITLADSCSSTTLKCNTLIILIKRRICKSTLKTILDDRLLLSARKMHILPQ